eukprot:CAMPEP_0177588356 /NCGR_PEP_ID=MMETSP0419_2-20121207/6181_1 /TAXON_ID=582737 /ORGANISM="Tetraselmis sp., Strain GSL018" /LENGTH=263 /DNA_ID=CAMNT_0019078547 /DNA_START=224 /DNA_END=1015 /DNA_ORIENTATION=-
MTTSLELPANLQKLVSQFQMVPDPKARYKQLLFFASKLPPMAADDHCPENKVEGCVSQVWVKPELRDGKVFWTADSDSQLTKGLAALLVQGLSDCTPEEIVRVDAGFIEMLGLKQSLTPSRNNGFLNMLRLMQKKALGLVAAGVAAGNSGGEEPPSPSAANGGSATPITDSMTEKLTAALKPARLEIKNESRRHASHADAMGIGGKPAAVTGETHFDVEIVSEAFEGLNTVKRHRMVYELLSEEFNEGLHALSLDTKTPAEAA